MKKKKPAPTRGGRMLRTWREVRDLTIGKAALEGKFYRNSWAGWEEGEFSPSVRAAAQLEDQTGIPMRAWTEA